MIKHGNVPVKDRLLKTCTGEQVEVVSRCTMVSDIHILNNYKTSAYVNPDNCECMICLCRMTQSDKSVLLSCGHALCQTCLSTLVSDHNSYQCPMCRQPFADILHRPQISKKESIVVMLSLIHI